MARTEDRLRGGRKVERLAIGPVGGVTAPAYGLGDLPAGRHLLVVLADVAEAGGVARFAAPVGPGARRHGHVPGPARLHEAGRVASDARRVAVARAALDVRQG